MPEESSAAGPHGDIIRMRHVTRALNSAAAAVATLAEDLGPPCLATVLKCSPVIINPPPPPVFSLCVQGRPHPGMKVDEFLERLRVTIRACAEVLESMDPNQVVRAPGDGA